MQLRYFPCPACCSTLELNKACACAMTAGAYHASNYAGARPLEMLLGHLLEGQSDVPIFSFSAS
jgi:hypothetical protein